MDDDVDDDDDMCVCAHRVLGTVPGSCIVCTEVSVISLLRKTQINFLANPIFFYGRRKGKIASPIFILWPF